MTSGTDSASRYAKPGRWLALALLLLSSILLLLGMGVGSTGWDSLALLQRDPSAWQIVWEIRLPRSVGAWLAGALLGLAGALAQGLFRNPLADPYLLGSGRDRRSESHVHSNDSLGRRTRLATRRDRSRGRRRLRR